MPLLDVSASILEVQNKVKVTRVQFAILEEQKVYFFEMLFRYFRFLFSGSRCVISIVTNTYICLKLIIFLTWVILFDELWHGFAQVLLVQLRDFQKPLRNIGKSRSREPPTETQKSWHCAALTMTGGTFCRQQFMSLLMSSDSGRLNLSCKDSSSMLSMAMRCFRISLVSDKRELQHQAVSYNDK